MSGPIPWWELPAVLAHVLALACLAVGALACVVAAAERVNRWTVDRSAPGDAASAGAGRWVVERPNGSRSPVPPVVAAETEQAAPAHRLRVGSVAGAVGDPTPQS